MKNLSSLFTRYPVVSGILVLAVIFLPYLIRGSEHVYYPILDNFDGSISVYKLLAGSDCFWNFKPGVYLPHVMNNSVLRNALPSCLNASSFLFCFFNPADAFLLIKIGSVIIAYTGFFLLLNYLYRGDAKQWLKIILSLAFACIQNHTAFGMATYTAYPLMLYAFLHYVEQPQKRFLCLAFVLPFTTSLVLTNIFAGFYLFFFSLMLIISDRKWQALVFSLIFFAGAVLSDYQILLDFFGATVESNRLLRHNPDGTFVTFLEKFGKYLTSDHINQQESSHTIPLLLSLLLFVPVFLFTKKERSRLFDTKVKTGVVLYLANLLLASVIVMKWIYEIPYLSVLFKQFNTSRFVVLNPTYAWLLISTLILNVASLYNTRTSKLLLAGVCILSLGYSLKCNHWLRNNWKIMVNRTPDEQLWNTALGMSNFDQFYSVKLFEQVKKAGIKRAACVGIQPSVLQFNYIETVDGYFNLFKLEHKLQIDSVNLPELRNLKVNDNGGNMAYLFSCQLLDCWNQQQAIISKTNTACPAQIHPNFDTERLKTLGATHIVSTVKIIHDKYTLVNTFEERDYPYRIFLYKI